MNNIEPLQIALLHPKTMFKFPLAAVTKYYAKVAGQIFIALRGTSLGSLLGQDWRRDLAIRMALYLEDIVSEVGIWASFTRKCGELYGKPLPMVECPDDYYANEPNIEDLMFLTWLAAIDDICEEDYLAFSPTSPQVLEVAEKIFPIIDKEFDMAPVNEEFVAALDEMGEHTDFYELRSWLDYFVSHCYLTNSSLENDLIEEIFSLHAEGGLDESQCHYLANVFAAFSCKVGPLALKPVEWLTMLLRERDNEAMARIVEQIEVRENQGYKVVERSDEALTLEDCKSDTYTLEIDSLGIVLNEEQEMEDAIGAESCIMSIVRYNGKWLLNGFARFDNATRLYDDYAAMQAEYDKKRQKVLKSFKKMSHDEELFFFRDLDEYRSFCKRNFPGIDIDTGSLQEVENINNIVVYFSKTGIVKAMPNAAQYIKADDNPFYDDSEATREDALELFFGDNGITGDTLSHIINHDMLDGLKLDPDEAPLTRDELDMLARARLRNRY